MTRRVGMLGLGAMGLPLARRLAGARVSGTGTATFRVSGFDLAGERRALAAAAGVEMTSSAVELAAGVEVLLVALPGAAAERAALLPAEGPGPLSALAPGSTLVELSSGAPDLSHDLAAATAERGVRFVSAPMAGSPEDAAEGALGLFIAGTAAHVGGVRAILETLAHPDRSRIVGDDPGAAQTVKLLVNALWFGQAALTGEVLLLAMRCGVHPASMQSLLAGSAAGGRFVDDDLPRLLRGDYLESFGVDGVIEELDTVVEAARMRGTPADLLAHVRELHLAARERFGSVDGELLAIKLLEERAGVQLRSRPAGSADRRGA